MPNATARRLALNIPLIVLWVAAIAVAGIGYWLLQSGNTAQADFYNEQRSDYLEFLNLQTQSTIGGMLLIAGVVGVFIALATHARNRAAAVVAANAVVIDDADLRALEDDDESEFVAVRPAEEPADTQVAAPSEAVVVESDAGTDTAEAETETAPAASAASSNTATDTDTDTASKRA